MQLLNTTTRELAPVHVIGETEDGRRIVQRIDGWELADDSGRSLEPADCDEDGNYLVEA